MKNLLKFLKSINYNENLFMGSSFLFNFSNLMFLIFTHTSNDDILMKFMAHSRNSYPKMNYYDYTSIFSFSRCLGHIRETANRICNICGVNGTFQNKSSLQITCSNNSLIVAESNVLLPYFST